MEDVKVEELDLLGGLVENLERMEDEDDDDPTPKIIKKETLRKPKVHVDIRISNDSDSNIDKPKK